MTQKKNKFEFASEEQRTKSINEIISYFQDERGEEIGVVAAENILEFFFDKFGEEIYKKAIKDCKKLIKEKFTDLDVELEVLSPNK